MSSTVTQPETTVSTPVEPSIKDYINAIHQGLELTVRKGALTLVEASNIHMIISSFKNDNKIGDVTPEQSYSLVYEALEKGIKSGAFTLTDSHNLVMSLNKIKDHITKPPVTDPTTSS